MNIANYAFTDLDADNALSDLVIDANDDVNNNNDFNFSDTGNASDDTDLVGDEDFNTPSSQITHKSPYIKSTDGEAVTPTAQEPDMGAVVPPDMACGMVQKFNENR